MWIVGPLLALAFSAVYLRTRDARESSRVVAGGSASLLVAVVGVLAGVIIGLGVDAHRPVYHDAFAAAAAGAVLYAGILALEGLTAEGPAVGFDAIRPLVEPLVFFPVFVLQALVVAVVVKRIRIWAVGDDTIEVP